MSSRTALRLLTPLALLAAGVLASAQTFVPMPQNPRRDFGGSVTPAFEGWYDNADGTHSFLIGYYSRNTEAAVDVPIGPNNHFEPGDPDRGQPTHFMPSRRYGVFVVTQPKEFTKDQKVTWVLGINGQTFNVPFHMHPDYNVSPFKSSEEGLHGYDMPPVLRFDEPGTKKFAGPAATVATAIARRATVNTPMPLDIWADDDALLPSTTPPNPERPRPPVTLEISKYRGPGEVTIAEPKPKLTALKGGKPEEPYSGKASTTVKFDKPGDYMLHVNANDFSGNGGGGSVCCWTTAIIKVAVSGSANTTGGQ
jgi:hypothetical protein